MANQKLIDHLNEILKHEWTGVAQYSQASFIIQGVWREVYAEKFSEDAEESFGHAKLVGDKIVASWRCPHGCSKRGEAVARLERGAPLQS